ncbi:MAG: CDP-alcohol phosphatidyltransferase family protein [Nitrospinaceae bacterium]|nr:CDP-alcohol phosphatidyltransferase family protein [Nitrospinaceae bacterium]
MTAPKTAVLRVIPSKEGTRFLFRHNIAGLYVFKRLIFSLQRASIENFIIIAQDIPASDKNWVEPDIKNDARFNSKFQWNALSKEPVEEKFNLIELPSEIDDVLLVESNLVTTAGLIKDFIASTQGLNKGDIAGLPVESGYSDGIYLLPPSSIGYYLRSGTFEKPVTRITQLGPWFYRQKVEDSQSARTVEKGLLNEHKLHYRQIMDIWVNSFFSIKISSFLVRTPFTPNQITLFGLVIGLAAGILFAQGNYWSGLMGGLLLAATAVWDCCDGDVARLKFMESDFGEKLDTVCDNIINVFIFVGLMFGTAHSQGLAQAMIPFLMLALGGSSIFYLIYFPKGGKGSFFKNTPIYDVIQILASRNFIYIIFIFAVVDKLGWFLWLAGIGSNVFAFSMYMVKRKILVSLVRETSE